VLGLAACSSALADGDLGTAADRQGVAYSIAGVHASPGTIHFIGLPWLLNSAEATGPIVITTHVGTFVAPVMSTTVTGVDPDAVMHAVGYSLSQRHDLLAVSSANLRAFESSRLEAYASFDETSWQVCDAASGAVLGSGSSFDPSGVFFQTVTARHVALPDMGVVELVPLCAAPPCAVPPGVEGEGDAGAADHQVPGFVPSSAGPLALGGAGKR
jgi:hypothetical protein